MRFLKFDANHELSLTKDLSTPPAPYAILSHTWGDDDEEVTFDDLEKQMGRNKSGYNKLLFCANQALEDGLEYCWVDTCCINKANHSELSEAIISMFRWYQEASKCYVYLSDVSVTKRSQHNPHLKWQTSFRRSRWFTRGWTLQELLAPDSVEFFSKEGSILGDKQTLAGLIQEITTIPIKALQGEPLSTFTVDARLQWAEKRHTKRPEDQAYCLLGIFGLFMPPMYGEGTHAFTRLKTEIDTKTRKSTDATGDTAENPSVIPFSRDVDFVGRVPILDRLHHLCAAPGSRTALVGLGGVGKSQLAIEYLYRLRDLSPRTWVFWVHASNAARFEQSYRDIADCVEIPERNAPGANMLQLVHNWLRNERSGTWVMILDNLDNADFLLEARRHSQEHQTNGRDARPLISYIPHCPNGAILVTSRSQEAALKLVEPRNIVTIDPMSEADAVTLLKKKLEEHNDGDRAIELARVLEFMPLAIVQAAAYICLRAPRCSVRQYLEEFLRSDQTRETLLKFEDGQLRRDLEAKNSIIITWQLSFDHIKHTRPSAADLLSLMSFFDPQGIPEALLRRRHERVDNPAKDEANDSGDCIQDVEQNHANTYGQIGTDCHDTLEDDIATLRGWAFISVASNGLSFEMHRLVQLATRRWLELHGEQERWKQQSIGVLDAEFPNALLFEKWARCQPLYPHVKSVATQKPEADEWLIKWASLLHKAVWYAQGMANWPDAEKLCLQVIDARTRVLKAGHPDILTSMNALGWTYLHQGRTEEAENINVQVLEARKETLGSDHPDTIISMINLVLTYQAQKRWHEAETLQMQVLQRLTSTYGADDPLTLDSRVILGQIHYRQGRLDTAEEMLTQALEISKRVGLAQHPNTLTTMHNLALILKAKHRDKEALALMTECLRLRKRVLGENHPKCANTSAVLRRWTAELA